VRRHLISGVRCLIKLNPTLGSLSTLFRKLERESYRAYHAKSKIHKADHFYNFCVTAHGLRDYYLEHIGKLAFNDKAPFHKIWNDNQLLVAVREIANTSKHFVLRDRKTNLPVNVKTKGVRQKKSIFYDVYANLEGQTKIVETLGNNISVTLSDGSSYDLSQFFQMVIAYWKSEIKKLGIKVIRQPLKYLQDT